MPPHLQGTASFSSQYDQLGRIFQTNRPDGGWTSYQYNITGTPGSEHQYVQIIEHVVGGAASLETNQKALFDGLARTYKTDSWGSGSNHVYAFTEFDDRGRVWKGHAPYYQGDPAYYTTYNYDCLSRVTDITTPDNKHITTSYRGLTTVVTDQNNHSTTSISDTFGRVRTVRDHNGTDTIYAYDILGNLMQIDSIHIKKSAGRKGD